MLQVVVANVVVFSLATGRLVRLSPTCDTAVAVMLAFSLGESTISLLSFSAFSHKPPDWSILSQFKATVAAK